MTAFTRCMVSFALLYGAALAPCGAASSTSSAASDSFGASSGSISTSVQKSSDSSKGTNVAEGDYRIIDVATYPERPGTLRVKLQAQADASEEGGFYLVLPAQTSAQAGLALGQRVTVRHRAYGLEFAAGPAREAFFLALSDAWYKELASHAVVL